MAILLFAYEIIIFTSAPSGKYHVIVGSYKKQSNAKKALLRLNKLGYKSAKILYNEKTKNFRISILSFETQISAINFTLKLNKLGFVDSWICDIYNSVKTSSTQPIKSGSNSIKLPHSKPNINLNLTSKNVPPVLEIKDEKDSKYHILVGSFKIEEYANNFKNRFKARRYLSAKVFAMKFNGDYNVVINSLK